MHYLSAYFEIFCTIKVRILFYWIEQSLLASNADKIEPGIHIYLLFCRQCRRADQPA
jgi:hypothetical protein